MTGGQLVETVSLIVKHYGHFKPEDFKLCFEEVKKGTYGPLYDRIDGQMIMSWLKQYDEQRDYAIAEINSNRNEVYKMQAKMPLLADKVINEAEADELFRVNIKKLNEDREARKQAKDEANKKQAETKAHDPVRKRCNAWIAQFEALYRLKPIKGRFVQKYGRKMDINEYLEHKQWQYMLAQLPRNERIEEYLTKYK